MAGERELPGLGLLGFWNYEADGWNEGMDANLRALSALVHLSVGSRTSALPSSPANGQIRIVPSGPNANRIAVRDNGAWVYLTPRLGMRAYVVDTGDFAVFDGSAWTTDDSSAGLSDAPDDGLTYARRNRQWVEVVFEPGEGGIGEAPEDGIPYVRQDGAWTPAPSGSGGGGGGGIPDAPDDDTIYGRSNGEWFPLLDVDGLPVAPVGGARIRATTAVPYTITGQYVPVRFDGVDRDTDGFTDKETPNRLTVPAGVTKVRLTMSLKADSGSGTSFPANSFLFTKNGVWQADSGLPNAAMPTHGYNNPSTAMVSDVLDVAEGDYFEVNAFIDREITLNADRHQTWFAIEVVERRLTTTGLNARMSDLLDADLTAPADGDVAVWSAADQKWRAGKPSVSIQEAASYARPFSGAMAKLNARKALATPTLPFPWDGTDYDTDGFWSAASPGRFTVRPGVTKVRLSAGLSPDGTAWSSTTNLVLEIYKNGSVFRGGGQVGWRIGYSDTGIATHTAVVPVVEGDYFELRFNCSASGTIAWQPDRCYFSIEAVEFETEIAT